MMIEEYWGLKENPFQNSLDSRFLYVSHIHKQALEMFDFVISQHLGVAMLTGLLGSGKSFLSHVLIERLKGRFKSCLVSNPRLNALELLYEIAYQLGVKDTPVTTKIELIHKIENILVSNLSEGRQTIIIIDEAHTIEEASVFEELRLLLNLQREARPLFSLFILGHSQLEEKISLNKALSQRIAVRLRLDRLTDQETLNYIEHRLNVSGKTKEIFTAESIALISELSAGIPRRINSLSGMSLFLGFQKKLKLIDEATIREVNNYLIA